MAVRIRRAQRAIALFAQPERWARLMRTAMAQDFSWDGAARQYLALYTAIAPPD